MSDLEVFALQPHGVPGRAVTGFVLLAVCKILYSESLFGFESILGLVPCVVFEFRVTAAKAGVGDIAVDVLDVEIFQGLAIVIAAVGGNLCLVRLPFAIFKVLVGLFDGGF